MFRELSCFRIRAIRTVPSPWSKRDGRRPSCMSSLTSPRSDTSAKLDGAFLSLTRIRPNAILVVADPFLASQQTRIAEFLVQAKIPSIYTYREQVTAGGLVSYSTNYHELFRRAAFIADKIHKGSKPGDLPVEHTTKIQLLINLKTAKA